MTLREFRDTVFLSAPLPERACVRDAGDTGHHCGTPTVKKRFSTSRAFQRPLIFERCWDRVHEPASETTDLRFKNFVSSLAAGPSTRSEKLCCCLAEVHECANNRNLMRGTSSVPEACGLFQNRGVASASYVLRVRAAAAERAAKRAQRRLVYAPGVTV